MMAALRRTLAWLGAFGRREEGSITLETILMVPLFTTAFFGMYATFDAYRMHAVQQKIAYSIGDIISRETTPINDAYMTGMRNLVKYLSRIDSNNDISVRVTIIRYDEDSNRYRRDWSRERGFRQGLTTNEVEWLGLNQRLPVMSDNDRLILVETAVKYTPPVDFGLPEFNIQNRVFTRPRYAPQVLFSND